MINEEIRDREVRLISADGEQLGVMPTRQALEMAEQAGLDLVKIAANAQPPVCKLMDYDKHRYEQSKRERDLRKNQRVVTLKEVQLSCTIDTHDFNTRVNQALRFLGEGNKVKVQLRFKGREMAHQDVGREVVERFVAACAEKGTTDKKPAVEGRYMSVIIAPLPQKKN